MKDESTRANKKEHAHCVGDTANAPGGCVDDADETPIWVDGPIKGGCPEGAKRERRERRAGIGKLYQITGAYA